MRMKKRIIWVVVSCLMVLSLVMASCGPAEEEEAEVEMGEEEVEVGEEEIEVGEEEVIEEEDGILPPEVPKYGGTATIVGGEGTHFDSLQYLRQFNYSVFFTNEELITGDWRKGPTGTGEASFIYGCAGRMDLMTGWLAESWESPDDETIIFHIRPGIHWWNKPPTNGRELTADDVEFTYNKLMATGEFAGQEPNMFYGSMFPAVEECVATDDHTVEFHLKAASPFAIDQIVMPWLNPAIACPEWYDLTDEEKADWHNVVGTGAFYPTEYVAGTSMTNVANPDYYGTDPRYDDNPLPYTDGIRVIVVADMDTALA